MRKFLLSFLCLCSIITLKATDQGYLGVVVNDYIGKQFNGALIINVMDDGAAKQYGLLDNDIVTSINNFPIVKKSDLVDYLKNKNWGDEVQITFNRNGIVKTTKIFLGYKGTTKTYNVYKNVKSDGEHWNFTDDKTEVLITEENIPISISKVNENGIKDEWIVAYPYKQEEVPQYFIDIDDKVFCIKRIKEDQAKRNCKINDIIYIKEFKDEKKEEIPAAKVELIPELFSVYPNPNNGQFNIKFSSNEKGTPQLLIFDITGRIVQTDIVQNFTGEFIKQYDLSNEAKGAYLIQLKIGDKLTSKKMILQ